MCRMARRWCGALPHQVHADAQPLVGLPQIEERPVGVVDARVGERQRAVLRAEGSEDGGAVPAWDHAWDGARARESQITRANSRRLVCWSRDIEHALWHVGTVAAGLLVEGYRGCAVA